MKYRMAFVSNSSSSSFVCDVCGTVETVYNCGLAETEMCACENGHTFCEEHLSTNREDLIREINENHKSNEEELDRNLETLDIEELQNGLKGLYYHEQMPESVCPLCTFQYFTIEHLETYIAEKYGDSDETIRSWLNEHKNGLH